VNAARSVRTVIVGGAVLLVAVPLALLTVAYLYERWISYRYEAHVTDLAEEIRKSGQPPAADLVRRAGVEVRILDGSGALTFDSHSDEAAVDVSLVGGTAERLLEHVIHSDPPERLAAVDAALGPLAERSEVRSALGGETALQMRVSPSGQTVVYSVAVPRQGGGAIYVVKASRRGIRRLFLLRRELLGLTLFQLVCALLFTRLLIRRVVRPLEELARAARRYPSAPLAGEKLLDRKDEIGEVARSITTLADELERRRRETAEVGADVAHEFKNPLATIAASAELIGTTHDATDEKRALVAEQIAGAVERLRRSIDALLALLRLEASLPDEPRAEVDYPRLVERILDEYRGDPRWAGHQLEAQIEVPMVRVAERSWAELLRNLIDNALVQPSQARRVIVRAARDGERVATTVRDFGPGVSPGNRDKIFRRFFTARPEGVPPGTGLGLAIVQAVAEAHGGAVTVDESAPGEGATFRVTLPH
jgi:two-component system sensor histidine kinase ChvG